MPDSDHSSDTVTSLEFQSLLWQKWRSAGRVSVTWQSASLKLKHNLGADFRLRLYVIQWMGSCLPVSFFLLSGAYSFQAERHPSPSVADNSTVQYLQYCIMLSCTNHFPGWHCAGGHNGCNCIWIPPLQYSIYSKYKYVISGSVMYLELLCRIITYLS